MVHHWVLVFGTNTQVGYILKSPNQEELKSRQIICFWSFRHGSTCTIHFQMEIEGPSKWPVIWYVKKKY